MWSHVNDSDQIRMWNIVKYSSKGKKGMLDVLLRNILRILIWNTMYHQMIFVVGLK